MTAQGDLFGAEGPRERLKSEFRLSRRVETEEAKRRAREGMQRAAAKQARNDPQWAPQARHHLELYAKHHRSFTGEEVKTYAYGAGLPKPANESAWGGVMAGFARTGAITFAGFEPAVGASRHGSPNRRWTSNICEGAQQ